MQFKSLAALLFASMALAAPAEVESRQDSDDFDLPIPNSILAVVATAVPSSFWAEATNTAAFLSQVEQGIASNSWPSWYSSLPDSVKEYVTTAVAGEYPSFFSSVSAEATSSGATDSTTAGTTEATTTGATTSDSTATESTTELTGSSTSATATGSDAASSSDSPSSSASGSPETTTSDGAAAPTSLTMGLAGAAGVLGLAIVL